VSLVKRWAQDLGGMWGSDSAVQLGDEKEKLLGMQLEDMCIRVLDSLWAIW
jgi:hypothetical protein